jgi:hypothetical protein
MKPPEVIAIVLIILSVAFVAAIVIYVSRNPQMRNPGYNFFTNRWSDDPPLKDRRPKPPKSPNPPS